MTGVGDRFAEPPCPSCGGAVVPAAAWCEMPEGQLLAWGRRLDDEQAEAERLQPGDEIPAPVLCLCPGHGPRAGLRMLRGEA